MSVLYLHSDVVVSILDNPKFEGTTEECKRYAQSHLKDCAPEFHPLVAIKWNSESDDWLIGSLYEEPWFSIRKVEASKATPPQSDMELHIQRFYQDRGESFTKYNGRVKQWTDERLAENWQLVNVMFYPAELESPYEGEYMIVMLKPRGAK